MRVILLLSITLYLIASSRAELTYTIAGNGQFGYLGDHGPAKEGEFRSPYDLALSPIGELYICEEYNSVIRKVYLNGITSTVAGNGMPGYTGDGGPATDATLN